VRIAAEAEVACKPVHPNSSTGSNHLRRDASPTCMKKSLSRQFDVSRWAMAALILYAASGMAEENAATALTALKRIPPEDTAKLVRTEGRDGVPAPKRWYFIVYDPQVKSGFREYAVEGGNPVEARTLSQFVESVLPTDVMPAASLKIDSDMAYRQLESHARAHGIVFSKINYVLKKDGPEAVPVWKLTCLDEAERSLATLTLTAVDGVVVAQSGFIRAPVAPEKAAEDADFLKKTALAGNPGGDDNSLSPNQPPVETTARPLQHDSQAQGSAQPNSEIAQGQLDIQTNSKNLANKPTTKEYSTPPKPSAPKKARRARPKPTPLPAGDGVRLENFLTGRTLNQ
jgi:hypothetical protein